MKRKGFTLVELSIVLVIIGLLIGGILAAQSMLTTAKINSVAMQIGQFDAGVENFRTKYNSLPGDSPLFGGDGDGLLTMANPSYPNAINSYTGEIPNFWNETFPDQYASLSFLAGGPPVLNGPGKNVPVSKLGLANSFFIASANSTGVTQYYIPTPIPANTFNYYAIVSSSLIKSTIVPPGCCYQLKPTGNPSAVTPIDLLALDTKIDDGIGNTGNVLAGNYPNAGDGSGYLSSTPLATCFSGGKYTTKNTYECTPLIRIGVQSGDLQ